MATRPSAELTLMRSWEEIGAAKRAHRDSLIPPSYRLSAQFLQNRADARDVRDTACDAVGLLMTQREIDVVYSDTAAIVHNLQSRTWSCVDVCTAFCKSAAIAQQMVRPPPPSLSSIPSVRPSVLVSLCQCVRLPGRSVLTYGVPVCTYTRQTA